jgi:hypothetical protein
MPPIRPARTRRDKAWPVPAKRKSRKHSTAKRPIFRRAGKDMKIYSLFLGDKG